MNLLFFSSILVKLSHQLEKLKNIMKNIYRTLSISKLNQTLKKMWNVDIVNHGDDYGEEDSCLGVTISKGNTKITLFDEHVFTPQIYEDILSCINNNKSYFHGFTNDSIIKYAVDTSELIFEVSNIGDGGDMYISIALDRDEAIPVISTIIEKYRTQSFSEE